MGWALRVSNCQMPKAAERVCAREHAPAGREAAARQRLRQLRRGYSIKDATQPWSALCVVRANTTHAALALAPFAAPARTVGARRGRRSSLAEAAEQLGARHRASAGRCAEALRWCTADARGATTAFNVTAPSIAAGRGVCIGQTRHDSSLLSLAVWPRRLSSSNVISGINSLTVAGSGNAISLNVESGPLAGREHGWL